MYNLVQYLFFSADCNPMAISFKMSSLLDFFGLGCDYLFWLVPVVIFFWPTISTKKEEKVYKKTKKKWSVYSSQASKSSLNYEANFSDPESDSVESEYDSEEDQKDEKFLKS